MTQPTHLLDQVFAIEVPEGSINFTVDMGYLIYKVPNYANWCTDAILSDYGRLSKYLETHSADKDYKTGGIPLPGNWQIICSSKECTEEQAKGVVEEYSIRGHKRFEDYSIEFMWQETALDSLRSLLTSKGLDPNKNYIILKKIA